MGPRPSDLLRMQFPCVEALGAMFTVLCIFSLTRKHLLDSFLYLLWAQGHHHLSHRRSLLKKEKKQKHCLFALNCRRNSFLVSTSQFVEGNPRPAPNHSLQSRSGVNIYFIFFYLGCYFCFIFAELRASWMLANASALRYNLILLSPTCLNFFPVQLAPRSLFLPLANW